MMPLFRRGLERHTIPKKGANLGAASESAMMGKLRMQMGELVGAEGRR